MSEPRVSDAERADIYGEYLAQILDVAAEMADQIAHLYARRAAHLREDLAHLKAGGLPSPVRSMVADNG